MHQCKLHRKDTRVTGGGPVNPSTCNLFLSCHVSTVIACLCVLFEAWVWWLKKLCKGFFLRAINKVTVTDLRGAAVTASDLC